MHSVMSEARNDNSSERDPLAGWAEALLADGALSPGLRESYRRTIAGFEVFCQQRVRAAGSAGPLGRRAAIALAREHVELQRLERVAE
jgi:hypothetical protein